MQVFCFRASFADVLWGDDALVAGTNDKTVCLLTYNSCPENKYILLDGLTYNTRRYFACCVVFFRAPKG